VTYTLPPLQGNWTYVAGVGCDPREDRYFLIPKQSRMYDADGAYMRHWLPELAARGAPTDCLHDPWRLRPEHRGTDYPTPVVQLLAQQQNRGGRGAGPHPLERAIAGAGAGGDVGGKRRGKPSAPPRSRAVHSGEGSRPAGGVAASSPPTHATACGVKGNTARVAAHVTSGDPGAVAIGDSAARTSALVASCSEGGSSSTVSDARGASTVAGVTPPPWPGRPGAGGRTRRVQHLTA
jgi:hypothetical protein